MQFTQEELLQEITELKRKLDVSKRWMEREVQQSTHKIATRHINKMSSSDRDDFLSQNQEEIIANQIKRYFWDLLLLNAPKNTVEYLVDAEISNFSLRKMPSGDGIGVVSSYTKILDGLIESIVTSQYRKFVLKQGPVILRANDPLEKALHLVITKKFTLSTGRLYGLLKAIRSGEPLKEFGAQFEKYLQKYSELGALLKGDAFYSRYKLLIEWEVFGGKRHSGRISFEETQKVRELLVGNFTDKNGILYLLLAHASVLF